MCIQAQSCEPRISSYDTYCRPFALIGWTLNQDRLWCLRCHPTREQLEWSSVHRFSWKTGRRQMICSSIFRNALRPLAPQRCINSPPETMVGPTDGFSDADHYGSSSHSHKAVILPTTRPPLGFGDSWDQRSLQFDKDAGIPEQRIPPDWTESSVDVKDNRTEP